MPLNRRKFLSSAAALSGALMTPFEQIFAEQPSFKIPADFTVKILATNWGFNGTIDEYCARVKQDGYDGIEIWWPGDKKAEDELFAALRKYQLELGFLCAGSDAKYEVHFKQFKEMVTAAATQQIQRPLYINCHSGRDYFPFEQSKTFIDLTQQLSKDNGVIICHETHRSRILFAAHVARQFVEKIPDLRVTFDVSHWCNVHESLLHDQDETVQMVLTRVDHIHARIGHPEGPQVNDPRAPEWEAPLKRHLEWWDKVVENKIKSGAKRLTILTEFGPPDYMPTLAYTRQALADQWNINVFMKDLLRKRYAPK
ncbi:MAG: xylose isomerase [Bacteroidetes bacterium]|nr:MAG: xylose isomerase [Bacteroidota bacterium]